MLDEFGTIFSLEVRLELDVQQTSGDLSIYHHTFGSKARRTCTTDGSDVPPDLASKFLEDR